MYENGAIGAESENPMVKRGLNKKTRKLPIRIWQNLVRTEYLLKLKRSILVSRKEFSMIFIRNTLRHPECRYILGTILC